MALEWAIEARGVSKSVSDGQATLDILRDVSFELAPGRSLAILGPSGCGKSTLLGILAGLDVPSSGEVRWAGRPISALSEEDRAQARNGHLGFVFQSFQLLPSLTALENVMLPLELSGRTDAESRAHQLLVQVGLADRAGHFPSTLSGGEQQRVALARAFVSEPELLFADEPTGSLDAENGERVMSILFDLQKRLCTTVIVVTHDESLASRCQERLRLSAGRLL
ncbi:MAG: ABC transporter ATP-binding protein [Betaproteobacteria bacterium]|nr:ABC transporter ATP-binding protein [Betaproteobacteria bacterium]NBY13799.1 ABC transporter ATP-binding protein [Betaproteobacteria bacterium]NCA16163.1 ABC transporter ATP-binding protein [Betaproteobacteria bacterium]